MISLSWVLFFIRIGSVATVPLTGHHLSRWLHERLLLSLCLVGILNWTLLRYGLLLVRVGLGRLVKASLGLLIGMVLLRLAIELSVVLRIGIHRLLPHCLIVRVGLRLVSILRLLRLLNDARIIIRSRSLMNRLGLECRLGIVLLWWLLLVVLGHILMWLAIIIGRTCTRVGMSMVWSTSSDKLTEFAVANLPIPVFIILLDQVLQSSVTEYRSVTCEDVFELHNRNITGFVLVVHVEVMFE